MAEMKGKVVLVTGGGAGIGKATAHLLAEQGARVAIADINEDGAEEAAHEIEEAGGEVLALEADVAHADAVKRMVKQTAEHFGRLDGAVNNAGLESTKVPIAEYKAEDWDRMMNVNLRGVWLCMKYEIRQLLEQESSGAIVNVASALGKVGFKNKSAYVAAKHGVLGLTKTGALEYAEQNIRINAVCPSFIETGMQMRTGTLIRPEQLEDVRSQHPLGRFGEPSEVAEGIVWLLSDASSFVTGEALSVDGGYMAK